MTHIRTNSALQLEKIRASLCASVAFQSVEFRRRLLSWFSRHGRDLPWRQTRDPYAILVSEFMLQQTQVATVLPYYKDWLRRFPTFAALARASENDVLLRWQGLGYYARARNLHATAKLVVGQHRVPFRERSTKWKSFPASANIPRARLERSRSARLCR